MDDFEHCKHFVGVENLRGEKLTEGQLKKWSEDPNRMYECIFCQIVEPLSFFELTKWKPASINRREGTCEVEEVNFTCCPRCREYKGIQPSIPGWSDFE